MKKLFVASLMIAGLVLVAANSAFATTNGDYRSAATGLWNGASTWQIWNGASWVTTNLAPAGGAGTNITIQSTHTVTDNVPITVTGTLTTQGTLTFSTGSLTVGSGGLILNSGSVTNSTAAKLIFNSGAKYQHNFTTTAGTVPTATWNAGSSCEIIGYTTLDNSTNGTPVIGGLNQSFANFTWNCLSQSGTMTAQGSLTTVNGNFMLASSGTGQLRLGNNALGNLSIGGNFSQTNGSFQLTGNSNRVISVAGSFSLTAGRFDMTAGGNATLNVAGDFIHIGGTLTESDASSPVANVVFNGTGIQNYASGGTVSNMVNFTVSNNATLFMSTNFLGSGSTGTFTLSAGATLGIGDPLGITTSGASGNIRVSGTRTYSTGASYIYNGPASQVTSNGLPATVSSLTISNTGGTVTLGSNVTVSNNLTVAAGTFDMGGFTANRATSGGTLAVANGATLKIGSTNPFPSNYATLNLGTGSTVEYEGAAQNVSPQAYGNLTTSGSGTKSLQAGTTSIAGNLTIGSGTTFNAGTNNFSLAGNLNNNGTAFAFSVPQTVTFNGSSPQTIGGTSPIAFSTVAINSGSVLNLVNNDTALALTIAGVGQASGTWGATGSGATNIDNTDFQGNGTLNVTPATLSIAFVQDAPSSATAGSIFSPAVTVQVTSSVSNLIANQSVTLSLNGGGTLNGTLSQPIDNTGMATFTNLSINVVGTNYSLIASVASLSLSTTGATFVVNAAPASQLVYTSLPATTNAAGSTLSAFTVQIADAYNNAIPTNGVPITMSLSSGTFASGTPTVYTASGGSATFSDLVITTAGNNTLTASAAGLTSANDPLVILPGTYMISFQQDAPSPATAGVTFSPPVAVKIADQYNNVLSNRTVTLSLLGGGTFNGTLSLTTTNTGVATFTNLTINVVGTNYSLVAASTNSLSVTGATFAVNAAAASKLVYTSAPATTNTAGSTLSAFTIQIQDPFTNNVPTNGVPITMSLSSGTFASGTITTNTVNGSATFSDLVITNAGNNTLTVSAPGLTSTNSALVILPAPYAISFQQDAPSPATAGVTFSPPVAVKIADQYNNVLSNRIVTLSLLGGGTLGGSTVRTTTVNGVASFTNLFITAAGTNYALIAASTNSLSVTGATFAVNAAPASKLVYTSVPAATNVAGSTLSAFTVQITDPFTNNVPTNGVPITMSLSSGTFASGTTPTNSDVNGSATFSDLVITNAGNNTLTASAPSLTSTNKAITIISGTAASIAFVQGPPSSVTAAAVFTNSVKVVDAFNNAISNATVTLAPNGFATLNGTLSRATAGNGVAAFTNLSVNTVGTGYSITATSGSLSTTSSLFNVTVGAIDHYLVSAATPQTRGVAFAVTVMAQDVGNNTVPDNSTVVTMSGSTAKVEFDANGDSTFGDNTQVLSNGTFTISTEDSIAETITITATDGNGKTGTSSAITVNGLAGDYRSSLTGPWGTASTWQIWDSANWVAASTPPAGGAGTNITIQSTHTVTDNVPVALTGTLITQGSLTFSTGSLAVGSGGLALNFGAITNSSTSTLIFTSGSTYEHARDGGTIPTGAYNSNSLLRVTGITVTVAKLPTNGVNGNVEWNCPNQTAPRLIFLGISGGQTQSIGGDFTIASTGTGFIMGGGGTNRNLTVGGNLNVQGGAYSALGGDGFSVGDVKVTVAHNLTVSGGTLTMVIGGATTNLGSGALTVGGDLAVNGGNLTILTGTTSVQSATSSMTVSGNTSVAGGILNLIDAVSGNSTGVTATLKGNLTINGGTISRGGSLPATVNFAGTSPQTYSKSAGTITGAVNFAILSGATVNFGTSLLDGSSGTFTLNSGGTIGIGDPQGITLTGASGNIRVSGTRTYSTSANYIYNGPASQVTSNGLPATVNSLTVSNSGGIVTLGSNASVTSNLTVSLGTFDLGSFTANRASNGGTITVANGAALKIGGTNTFPTNYLNRVIGASSTVEFEGSTQSVPTLAYGSLATSGSGIKTLLAGTTTITGNLTIGPGTTFAAGTNNFSIAGNWSNNGNGFTATNAQTVTFNGASPQTIDGSSATAFNNVAINSGSELNLAVNGSTAQLLSIAGVNQLSGTWGATGSGATHVDNVDFQGSGTLNVLSALTIPSTTTLGTSGSPSPYGQPVTFTATVTGTGPTPTGTVTFMAGANTLGIQALSGSPTGTAAVVTGGLLFGSYTITAVYSGDANFLASSNSLVQQVNLAPLTITANSAIKTYGQTVLFTDTEFTPSGLTNGDTVTSVTLKSDGTLATAAAGNYSIIPTNAIGTGLANYTINYQNGTLTVNQAPVTGSITATNKVYDGTTTATISGYSLSGVLFGDDATLTGGTATFSDKNVGTGKSVTATGLTLAGAKAGDYYLTSSNASTTADITAAPLTVSADNKSRPYGQPNPPLTASYSGFGTGDNTNVLFGAPNLTTTADTNSPVASYPIFVTAGSLNAANYSFTFTNGILTVTKAILTVTADDQSRPYGTTNPVFTATFTGFLSSDTTNVVSGVPNFNTTADTNSPVAGNPYSITVTNGTLIATNYDFAFVDGQLTIIPATVSGSITASNKVYDGTMAATIASYALSGVIGTDDVVLTDGTANFIDKNVGTGKLVTATGLALSGTTTGNYTLASSTTNTMADITAYPLTVTATTYTKPYDGSTSAAASPSITVGSLQGTDTATFSETYDTKNVGTGKTLTPTATISDGNGGTNYFVTFVNDTTGVITNLMLTGSITVSNKVYDGTMAATISSYALSGVLGLEDVSLTGGTANFSDQNVGTGKSVTANGLTLSGAAAGNYTVNTTASATADITPAPLTIIADNKSKTAGLPNPTLTATYVGFVSGDNTNVLTTPATLSTAATDSSPAGAYPITASGAVATNYAISYTGGTLTVVGVPQITNTKVSGNQFIFSFPTLLHEEYQVEFKDDLTAPTWTSVGGLIDGTGNFITVTNAITGSKRFYRVEVSPGN
jgi:hypothetical protein